MQTMKLRTGLNLLIGLLAVMSISLTSAHAEEGDMNTTLLLNSDAFFGFNPQFMASKKMGESWDLTVYGIQWSGGVGETWGNWTEFGLGAAFKVGDGLMFNPQIGILNGNLLSSGGNGTNNDRPARLAEGVVPNFTLVYNKGHLEGEVYAGYYYGLRTDSTFDFLHFWVNAGYRLSDLFATGLHFEQLRFMGGRDNDTAAVNYYVAAGPYFQFSNRDKSRFIRFTAGVDTRTGSERTRSGVGLTDFSKLTLGFTL